MNKQKKKNIDNTVGRQYLKIYKTGRTTKSLRTFDLDKCIWTFHEMRSQR